MAQRRMFSLDIVNEDKFIEMPVTSQALYFHLGLRADDEGFVGSVKQIIRGLGFQMGDLKTLMENEYVYAFDSGVVVIKDWNVHNNIRKDRLKETRYAEEKNQLLLVDDVYNFIECSNSNSAVSCQPNVNQMSAQVRLGKVRLGKVSIDKDTPVPKPKKIKYGEFEKVSLTENEHQKLIEKLGQTVVDDFISRLDNYKASTGKTYKSDYATILNWQRKEPIKTDKPQTKANKFHNFIQSNDVVDLEAVAEQRRNKLQEKLKG